MSSRRTELIALLFLLLLLIVFPQAAHAQETLSSEDPNELARSLLQAVNDTRQQNGLAPLEPHSLLAQAAQHHAADMAAHSLFSHYGSDGSSVAMRATRVGYTSGGGVTENWVSTRSVAGALAWWMNSYVHRGNLLNPKWRDAGVGVARDPNNGLLIFVLVFGGGNGSVQSAALSTASSEPAPIAALPAPPAGILYVVQPGDTLLDIALQYDVAWQSIADLNGLSEQTLLQIGNTLLLPNDASIASHAASAIGGATDQGQGYTVRSGETLAAIAAKYGIPWQDLAAANGLGVDDILRIGQTLRIPVVGTVTQEQAAGNTATAAYYHTVQKGDTVISIALRYNLDWKELLRENGLRENTVLSIGQQLRLN